MKALSARKWSASKLRREPIRHGALTVHRKCAVVSERPKGKPRRKRCAVGLPLTARSRRTRLAGRSRAGS
jgi:hypothetical protein